MFAAIVVALAASPVISLSVDSGVACVSTNSLTERLSRAGISTRPNASTVVSIRQGRSALFVEARNGSTRFRRELNLGSCGPVERAVVLLVSSWLRQLPTAERTVAVTPVEPSLPEPVVPPVEAEALEVPDPLPEPLEPIIVRRPIANVVAVAEPAPPIRPTLDVSLLGGGSIGATPQLTGAGLLAMNVGFGRFGLGADLGFESIRAIDIAPARIETLSKWATLNGRVGFQPAEIVTLDVTLGLRAWHIGAVALNVDASTPAGVWAVGGALSLGAALRITAAIAAEVRVFGSVRHRPERFALDGYGTAMTLETVQGGLLVGISWRALGN